MDTKKKPYKLAVVIGRFQIKHAGHNLLFNKAMQVADNVLVLIGSSKQPRTIKNPFTFKERAVMVRRHFEDNGWKDKVIITSLVDHLYSDDAWVKQVQQHISAAKSVLRIKDSDVGIVGMDKDESSYYLKMFPQYGLGLLENPEVQFDATDLRNIYFSNPLMLPGENVIPKYVREFLEEFRKKPEYERLVREWKYYESYPKKYGKGPFVTVDAIIKKAGHVLLIKRDDDPGEGLWALPGGFMELNERIYDACLREVSEETNIDVPPGILDGSLQRAEVFDHPKRSLRGRIITHAYYFDLDGKDKKEGLPKTRASSDARETKWFPIDQAITMDEQMYEDHPHILRKMLGLQ